jgi:transketolase
MRAAFVKTLLELASRDGRIVLLTGDLGFMALEPFAERFPSRFFNVGVAEQNMMGLATGLADAGFLPFVYSIAPFAVLRPMEFFRNGPVFQSLPVRVVGVGGGMEYGPNGLTHHALEDVSVMRTQPGVTVLAPADHEQARAALLATWDLPGPLYLRLGKDDLSTVPGLDGRFELGRAQVVRTGDDLLVVAMGGIASEAARAADELEKRGIRATLMVVASVAPPPVEDLAEAARRFTAVLTVEAHYAVGGLGSLVAGVIAGRGLACKLTMAAVKEVPAGPTGSHAYLLDRHGLSAGKLVEAALGALGAASGGAHG